MNDRKQIKQLQSGVSDKVDDIVNEHYANVYSFILRKCGNEDLAKEITQETFYRFFANIHSYESQGKLSNYLYRVALNRLYDEYRKNKNLVSAFDFNMAVDPALTSIEKYDQKRRAEKVRKLLAQLSAQQQDIIILRFYHDMKFKDISSVTGIHVSTIKSRIKTTLQQLAQMWKEGEIDEK